MGNWGGARVGAGAKKKQKPADVLQHPSAPALPVPTVAEKPIEPFDPPSDLEADVRAVWDAMAPHAFRERTLTPARTESFVRYCRMAAKERALWKDSSCNDSAHGRLRKELNALELQFKLTGDGRPVVQASAAAAKDADDEYFGAVKPRVG